MSNWLLIITIVSGLWGEGTPVTQVTMHDFPSWFLCESAAIRTKEMIGSDATVSHKCLSKTSDVKWGEVK